MEVEAEKSDCIGTWNYSFLKECRGELDGGLTLFLEDNEAGLNMDRREPRAKSQS